MKLMILGASQPQIPYIKRAKEKEIEIIVLDRNKNAPGIKYADKYIENDFNNKEEVYKLAKENKIDGIICPGTDKSIVTSYVAMKLGLVTPPHKSTKIVSNKFTFRKHLRENNFNFPKTIFMDKKRFIELNKFPYDIGEKVVVKPTQSMGARGVLFFNKEINKEKVINETFKFGNETLIEEFLSGPEFSIDTFFYKGELNIIGISERSFFLRPNFIEKSHRMPAKLNDDIKNEIIDLLNKMGKSLKIENGSMKVDLKISNGKIYFIELALRSSGKSFHEIAEEVYGYEIIGNIIDLYLGKKPKKINNYNSNHYGIEKSVFSIPGIFNSIEQINKEKCFQISYNKDKIITLLNGKIYEINKNGVAKELYSISPKTGFFTDYKKGDKLSFPSDNSKIVGSFIQYGEDKDIDFFIRLEPNIKETDDFINDSGFYYV